MPAPHSLHAVCAGPFKGKQVQLAKCHEECRSGRSRLQMEQINISKEGAAYLTAMHISAAAAATCLALGYITFRVSGGLTFLEWREREKSEVSPSPHTSHMLLRRGERQANMSPETRSGKKEVGKGSEISLSLH